MRKKIAKSQIYETLQKKRNDLFEELTKLVTDRDILESTVRINLETEYQMKIGRRQYDLFILKTEVLRLKRKIEIIQANINRNEEYSLDLIEQQLDKELKKWEDEMHLLYNKITAAERYNNSPKLSFNESIELRKLYFKLAKMLHPDLNEDLKDEQRNLWSRAVDAYKNGDLEELKILQTIAEEGLTPTGDSTAIEMLESKCLVLKDKIIQMVNKISQIKEKFPFNLEDKLNDNNWIEEQTYLISEEVIKISEQKNMYKEILSDLILFKDKKLRIN